MPDEDVYRDLGRLEAKVESIQRDVSEIKADVKKMPDHCASHDLRIAALESRPVAEAQARPHLVWTTAKWSMIGSGLAAFLYSVVEFCKGKGLFH